MAVEKKATMESVIPDRQPGQKLLLFKKFYIIIFSYEHVQFSLSIDLFSKDIILPRTQTIVYDLETTIHVFELNSID